jgi:shikimate dehydrogenase
MASSSYFVIGHPLGHSMSPFIHRRLFSLQNRQAEYAARDIPPEDLPAALPELLQTVQGLNVTIPHKQAVIPFLDRLEGRAELYRSVNTISVTASGTVGYNTDADGFLHALKDGGAALEGRVALLGCGGVGRTFACEAALAGCRILNAVRPEDLAAAEDLKAYVLRLAPGTAYDITALDGLADRAAPGIDLLINATPVGMYPRADASPVDDRVLRHTKAVFDAVYNPAKTRLLSLAEACGAKTVAGMPMLVWQAVVAHQLWYGAEFQINDIRALIADAQAEMERSFG